MNKLGLAIYATEENDKRLARSLAQPKEKRSRYHNSHNYVIKPYRIGFKVEPQPITTDKKKQFAINFLHTLAKLENNIDQLIISLK